MGMAQSEANAAGVREGDVLAGKYRVERVLGVGGMGVVVAAHHMQLDERSRSSSCCPRRSRTPTRGRASRARRGRR